MAYNLRRQFEYTPMKRPAPVSGEAPGPKKRPINSSIGEITGDAKIELPVKAKRKLNLKAAPQGAPCSTSKCEDKDPLKDILRPGLDLVFVGINPGTHSARHRRHYAGPNNMFWPLLYESRLVTEPLTYADDERVVEWGIGLTNIVQRPSPSSQDLHRTEIVDGAVSLRARLLRARPRVVCFNGKGIYEVFAGRRCEVGLQDATLPGTDTRVYVMPSTSGRTSAYPTRASKLPFFVELRDLIGRLKAGEASRPIE